MIVLTCLLWSLGSSAELDEISFRYFEAQVRHNETIFFSVSPVGRPVIARLDIDTGAFSICEDTRFPLVAVDTMMVLDEELIVLDHILKHFFRLDQTLTYLGKISLAEFDWGAFSTHKPRFAHIIEPGLLLVTLQDHDDRGKITLARLDYRTRKVDILANKTIDSKQEGYWYPWEGRLLFIHVNLGRIDLTDPDHPGKTMKILYPGIDRPIEKRKYRRPWRPPYRWVLSYTNRLKGESVWVWNHLVDDAGNELDVHVLRDRLLRLSPDGGVTLEKTRQFPIAETENGALIIDWEEPVLRWLPRGE